MIIFVAVYVASCAVAVKSQVVGMLQRKLGKQLPEKVEIHSLLGSSETWQKKTLDSKALRKSIDFGK